MNFITKLKLGNITNLSDARFAAAVGIDYLGSCFDPSSENYIAPIKAKEIIDWTTGVHIVAEFGEQSPDEIRDISELLNVDGIELNNRMLPDECATLEKGLIKKTDVSSFDEEGLKTELGAYAASCDVFHLYASKPVQLNESLMQELCRSYKIIWGFEFTSATVMQIIDTYKPYALHVSGGVEEKAGIKDFDELNDLLDVIRAEE